MSEELSECDKPVGKGRFAMRRVFRQALSLVATSILSGSAVACTTPPGVDYSDEANVSRADLIFIAHVTRTEEVVQGAENNAENVSMFDFGWVATTYRLLDPIKGKVPEQGVVATWFSFCHTTLLPGVDYVLFVKIHRDKKRLEVLSANDGTRQVSIRGVKSDQYIENIKKLASGKTDTHL